MSEAYHRAAHGVANPPSACSTSARGNEGSRGGPREAHRILREGKIDLDYGGFVEGDDITHGSVDVVVSNT